MAVTQDDRDEERDLKELFRRTAGADLEVDAYELRSILDSKLRAGMYTTITVEILSPFGIPTSVCLSLCLSLCVSLPGCLSLCLLIYLPVSRISLSVHLSVCMSVPAHMDKTS